MDGQPVKNVTKTPLVAGNGSASDHKFDLVITANKSAPEIAVAAAGAADVRRGRRATDNHKAR